MAEGRLGGKVALITGGTAGIGRGIADRFVAEGAAVMLFGRDRDPARAAVDELRAAHPGCAVAACTGDVRGARDIADAIAETERSLGPLTTAVIAARAAVDGSLAGTSRADWEVAVSTNLTGAWLTGRAALDRLVANGGGSIVIVASGAGLVGQRRAGAFSVTQAGLLMLTRMLALDAAPAQVRVNAVCPPLVPPDGRHAGPRGAAPVAAADGRQADAPIGMEVSAADVAAAAAYLASDDARFVTGIALPVEGGATAGIPNYGDDEMRLDEAADVADAVPGEVDADG